MEPSVLMFSTDYKGDEVVGLGFNPTKSLQYAGNLVLSELAPPLADECSIGYRAASHSGADADAVLGMRIGSRDR